jgi:ribosomal protein S14
LFGRTSQRPLYRPANLYLLLRLYYTGTVHNKRKNPAISGTFENSLSRTRFRELAFENSLSGTRFRELAYKNRLSRTHFQELAFENSLSGTRFRELTFMNSLSRTRFQELAFEGTLNLLLIKFKFKY